jgi:RNA polymerase sigma factor (TIGR02999 family)
MPLHDAGRGGARFDRPSPVVDSRVEVNSGSEGGLGHLGVFAATTPAAGTVAHWLARWRAGDRTALESLVPFVYHELRTVARRQLSREWPDHTLSPTALVHETYLRLLQQHQVQILDRDGLLAIAGLTMRRILVDHARSRTRQKRGGDARPRPLDADDDLPLLSDIEADEVLAIDVALDRLAQLDDRARQVVEYRVFGGLTLQETADALGISSKSVQRTWTTARAWLRKELQPGLGSREGRVP